VECKWSADDFEPAGMAAFRQHYPKGENVVIAHDVDAPYVRTYADVKVHFEGLSTLANRIHGP
jgi:uncharacterized protein